MRLLLDPRKGDVEDDQSSTKSRSIGSLATSFLAEISLPKLLVAWTLLIGLPALLLGAAPIIASIWAHIVVSKASYILAGLWPAVGVIILFCVAAFGARRFLRLVESNFWSLNALAVQPCYALLRECIRHIVERSLTLDSRNAKRSRRRALAAAMSGLLMCGASLLAFIYAWPATRWTGTASDLVSPQGLIVPILANVTAVITAYVAVAALIWGVADATMPQPSSLDAFAQLPESKSKWRIVHLSDIHVVGERYGFRIESGRSGPQGNERFQQLLASLDELHRRTPVDAILMTGDITDAGRSSEWAEFFDALRPYPDLAALILALPGNHDINVVDRANPARLDLPWSPNKRLREVRALAALTSIQGDRVRTIDLARGKLGPTLAESIAPYRAKIAAFSEGGALRLSLQLGDVWERTFPWIKPPESEEGLGIILINSNAETHFSFTNALGLVSAEQSAAIDVATRTYPRASWIVALHHHVVEYPIPGGALMESIGTALINGSWFVRRLQKIPNAIVMHGHRHIDWIGECGKVVIVSAPSPVMDATDYDTTYYYVHSFAVGERGQLELLEPERICLPGRAAAEIA